MPNLLFKDQVEQKVTKSIDAIKCPPWHPLPDMLCVAVPLRLIELERSGGPSEADLEFCRTYANELAEHGDDLLFKSKVPGRSAELFNGLARALSIMAFCPGGVRVFGSWWKAGKMNEKSS